MDEKLAALVAQFEKAHSRLLEVLALEKTEIVRDSAVLRFELTLELCWKVMRAFAAGQEIETRSPREALQQAYRFGFIDDAEQFIAMLGQRNVAVHTDNEEFADGLYQRLPNWARLLGEAIARVGNYFTK